MNLNIGIDENKRVEIATSLSQLLAESYTLYLKTHKYHWNVTGPMFQTLHLMFETQYNELALAVDEIAERIRVMGVKAPGSYGEFAKLSSVKEDTSTNTEANVMIQNLLNDHETIVRSAKGILPLLEGANDEGTNSLLGARIEYHEKTAWMLRSLIG
ncbi:Dps family protein [Bacteriovorax sp. Seq25_V]|uniref:Dps family protein n=1 Tax=Bacteriovorax sp. Seq25_V TaxID=1201288 RepID=UPI000389F6B4|nr:Dps family protein [Bacteriovorax sp. Seq25_V]EQC43763.1 ferritin-like protein [Bacteriovorax sp. Seq25_V]